MLSDNTAQVQCDEVNMADVPSSVSLRKVGSVVCATISDKSGIFVFPALPPGNFALVRK